MTGDARRASMLEPHARALDELGSREAVVASQVSLRVDARVAGLDPPRTPNTWATFDGREMLWLGPDEWLVVSETEPAAVVAADLHAAVGGEHHSIVDVSANRVAIEFHGPNRMKLLSAGCGLDLHPRSWRRGICAQTLLANVAVLLQEREDATRVFVRPSFAGHLVAWLRIVAAEG